MPACAVHKPVDSLVYSSRPRSEANEEIISSGTPVPTGRQIHACGLPLNINTLPRRCPGSGLGARCSQLSSIARPVDKSVAFALHFVWSRNHGIAICSLERGKTTAGATNARIDPCSESAIGFPTEASPHARPKLGDVTNCGGVRNPRCHMVQPSAVTGQPRERSDASHAPTVPQSASRDQVGLLGVAVPGRAVVAATGGGQREGVTW
jgi:hypothetical protein